MTTTGKGKVRAYPATVVAVDNVEPPADRDKKAEEAEHDG